MNILDENYAYVVLLPALLNFPLLKPKSFLKIIKEVNNET
jgi:hypothetical protein